MNVKISKLSSESIPAILELESHSAPEEPMYFKYDEEILNKHF